MRTHTTSNHIENSALYPEPTYIPQTYEVGMMSNTETGKRSVITSSVLPADIDIFAELPEKVFAFPEVSNFLSVFKEIMPSYNFSGLTLAKLRVSEQTDRTLMLDWLFNYFRVYFFFDLVGNNSYGMIENNTEKNTFSTICKALASEEYKKISVEVLSFVIERMRG